MIQKLALLTLAVSAAAPGILPKGQDSVRAVRTYESIGGGKIEGLGACAVSADSIRCWDMDGKDSPGLAEQVRAHFVTQPNDQIRLAFRKKNRLLVVRQSNRLSGYPTSLPGKANIQQAFTISEERDTISFYRCVTRTTETTVAIPFSITLPNEAPIDLPLRPGAEAASERMSVKLLGHKPGPKLDTKSMGNSWPENVYGAGRTWFLSVNYKNLAGPEPGEVQNSGLNFSIEAADQNGNTLRWVDGQGKPVAEALAMAEMNELGRTGQFQAPRKYRPVAIYRNEVNGGEVRSQMNIDPKFISSVRIWQPRSLSVELSGFPLDPIRQE